MAVDYQKRPEAGYVTKELEAKLHKMWETKPGLFGVIATVDHKVIGIRYIVTAFAFLVVGGLQALLMRLQLAQPDQTILTPEQYNQLFSMHGITMIFLYALPILSGFSNYLFPLLLGTRDMAFPRLNAFSYWVYLASGLFMYASFLIGQAPNNGWFNYAPYALKPFNPGLNMDFYALGMVFFGISTTVGAANFVVTVMRNRAPGMSINRLPIMIWGTTTVSVGILLANPAVSLAFFLLWLDRQFGTHFYDTAGGGQPLLWQHLFWIFAHPWVYIIVLPAMGMVSDALPVFCRRPLVAYTLVILATITTMLLGFGVWVHHMFATGIPFLSMSYFSGASFIITIPSAIATFAWIATIWTGRVVVTTAFLYFAGFISMFVIGGVSGVVTASVAADLQLHDTYFVVAHIHYVLIGINLFGVLGGLYFWFPKMSGKMLSERLGRWNFWLTFLGFNLAFLPMHWTGLLGMPRRIYTYPEGAGWSWVNMLTTVGSFILAFGILLLFVNVWMSLRRGVAAGANPWDAPSLEWATASPPPAYNFTVMPVVASRHPLWEDRLGESEGHSSIERGLILDDGKEMLATSVIDAAPRAILKMPEDDPWPFLVTLAMTLGFTALLLHWWWIGLAAGVATLLGCVFWLWPRGDLAQTKGTAHE
ncbi:cytochrome c oxidase subunit 1/cytochrome c oxidase subunit I+III [Fulvimarina manganoxydans]|uniref:Cytochrome c oxidase subunit 1 n=1 Tax=Fulvimarina manganoxydans TaxID=937218 RepID=A0A1W2D116_9HYPH|nr:cytochrome c oxidase subunit 1/cytochrome c oxidase subunit I+III [Fulvimarina manganoxydans]